MKKTYNTLWGIYLIGRLSFVTNITKFFSQERRADGACREVANRRRWRYERE